MASLCSLMIASTSITAYAGVVGKSSSRYPKVVEGATTAADTYLNGAEIHMLSSSTRSQMMSFVIKTKKKTYLIETNFYNTGGSKLNEVARAYSEVAPKINQYENYEFVWITDGQGWLSAKNKLEEAYNTIPSVYNLTTLSEFVEKVKKEETIKF